MVNLSGIKNNKLLWLVMGAVVASLATYYGFNLQDVNINNSDILSAPSVIGYSDKNNLSDLGGEYKAVFLDNGQTYFGKLDQTDSQFIALTDIYYLRLTDSLHNQKFDETKNPLPSQLVLIKLGKELHGPRDEMRINKDHVLFIESLQDNSMVVKAIFDYKNQK